MNRHLLLSSQCQLPLLLNHLDVVREGLNVLSVGWQLVVVGTMRLEHLHDVVVLSLISNWNIQSCP